MKKIFYKLLLIFALFINNSCSNTDYQRRQDIPFISVSEDGHYLLKEGKPFFWLGDTGWFLFTQPPEDVEMYMQNRVRHGFNTIQMMVTNKRFNSPEFRNNYRGDVPFKSLDPVEFNEMYFAHIDDILEKAEKYNIVIVLFPTWGWSLDQMFSTEKPENAYNLGFLLGNRYKNYKNVIWSVCGEYHKIAWESEPKKPDSNPDEKELVLIENLALGLKEGHGGAHLMTIHPDGWKSSSEHFHESEWLDFNMIQSWSIGKGNEMDTNDDYLRIPAKPALLAEPGYEFGGGSHQAFEVRYEGYHSVLNGGMGYTYGCEGIWNFKENWKDLLNSKGASQMIYLRRLFESRSFTERVPAQGLIGGAPGEWATLQKAMAGIAKDSTWAIVYFPNDTCKRNIKTGIISGDRMNAWWYNPRDGKCYTLENVETNLPFAEYVSNEIQIYEFDPPGNGGPPYDWVLILDNANEGYVQP